LGTFRAALDGLCTAKSHNLKEQDDRNWLIRVKAVIDRCPSHCNNEEVPPELILNWD